MLHEKSKADAVGRHVADLMGQAPPGKKSRHTHYLTTDSYHRFEQICRSRDRGPSEVLDALIRDFLERYDSVADGPEGDGEKSVPPSQK